TVEDIKRNCNQFQRHEQQAEIVGRGGKKHSRQAKQNQRVELCNPRFDAVRKLNRNEQHHQSGQEEEPLEEQSQRIECVWTVRRICAKGELCVTRRHPDENQAIKQNRSQSNRRHITELLFRCRRQPQIHNEQSKRQRQHQQFVTDRK